MNEFQVLTIIGMRLLQYLSACGLQACPKYFSFLLVQVLFPAPGNDQMWGLKSGADLQLDQLDGPHSCLCLGLVPFKLGWDFGKLKSLCFRFFKVELVWKTPPGQFQCVTVMAEVLSTITSLQNLDMWCKRFCFLYQSIAESRCAEVTEENHWDCML